MDVLVFSLSLGILVAVWVLINKRMKPQHWIIRNCAGASAGVVSMFVVVALALEVGLIEEATSSSGERDGSDKEEPESNAVIVLDQQGSSPGQGVIKILDKFTPIFLEYLDKGIRMEPYRGEVACMEDMEQYRPAFQKVRGDFSEAVGALPVSERFDPALEPLHNSSIDILWCLNCTSSAGESCAAAIEKLDF